MKEYFEIQKNPSVLMSIIIAGFASMMFSIVLLCTDAIILGIILSVCTVVGVTLSLCILVANCELSKIQISGKGIQFKEKEGLKFISWDEFTNCEVEHKSRGVYKFVLIANEKKYTICHVKDVLEKLISYCSVSEFAKLLKSQIDKV